MTNTYYTVIRCCAIDCDRAFYCFTSIGNGKTVPLCAAHSLRYNTKKVLGGPIRVRKETPTPCNVPGCDALPVDKRSRCAEHLGKRFIPGTATPPPETCEVDSCNREAHSRYGTSGPVYCKTHYARAKRNNGDVNPDLPIRTIEETAKYAREMRAAAAPGPSPMGDMGCFAPSPPPPPLPSVQTDWAD